MQDYCGVEKSAGRRPRSRRDHAINSSNEESVDAVKTLTRGGVQVSIDALGIGTTAWCAASAGPTR
jgi:NADPH:quinone reductase-like Zn-dependent oxidoreductase